MRHKITCVLSLLLVAVMLLSPVGDMTSVLASGTENAQEAEPSDGGQDGSGSSADGKTVTLNGDEHGTVQFVEDGEAMDASESEKSYPVGSEVSFQITTEDSYEMEDIETSIGGQEADLDIQYDLDTRIYSFTMPDEDVMLDVTYLRTRTVDELNEVARSLLPSASSKIARAPRLLASNANTASSGARASGSAYLTVGDSVYYGGYETHFYSADGNTAYCIQPNYRSPDEGTYNKVELYTVPNSNGNQMSVDRLRAALWFSYGAPGFEKDMWPSTWWDGTPISEAGLYCLSHMLVSRVYSNDGGDYGVSDELADWAWYNVTGNNDAASTDSTLLQVLRRVDEVPDNFEGFILDTGSSQLIIGFDYNPETYTDLKVQKTWSDFENQLGARPSSVTVNLYQSTSSSVDTSGTPYKTATLNESNNWTYTWKDLPKTSGETTYYYAVKEASVPDNYTDSYTQFGSGTTATIKNTVLFGYLNLHKDSANTDATDGNTNYSLAGAEYTVYENYSDGKLSDTVGTLTTDENGDTNTIRLLQKTYYVQETKAATGYELDDTVYTVTITADHTSSSPYKLEVEDVPQTSSLKLYKSSALPGITDDNNCYSLKGAEYTVYTDESCSTEFGKIITDENGEGTLDEIPFGTYYIKETAASEGYEIDENVYPVTLDSSHTTEQPYELEVEEVPGNDPSGIQITKIWDGEETETIPTLEGTQFTINYYDGYYTKDNLPDTPTRTWVFEVQEVNGRYLILLTDTYLVEELSDELYRDGAGNPCLPYGTISIQETKPAAGYTLNGYLEDENGNVISTDSEIYVAQINNESGAAALQGGNEFSRYNTPVPGSIRLMKYDSDGKTPLAGVTFEIKDSSGEVIETAVTDSSGEAVFEDLYPDVYTITETETTNGHSLLQDQIVIEVPTRVTEVYINENNIDTDKVIYDPADDIYYIHNFTYEVTNSVAFEMPAAGNFTDAWTFIPLIAGFVMVAVAAFLVNRKRNISRPRIRR